MRRPSAFCFNGVKESNLRGEREESVVIIIQHRCGSTSPFILQVFKLFKFIPSGFLPILSVLSHRPKAFGNDLENNNRWTICCSYIIPTNSSFVFFLWHWNLAWGRFSEKSVRETPEWVCAFVCVCVRLCGSLPALWQHLTPVVWLSASEQEAFVAVSGFRSAYLPARNTEDTSVAGCWLTTAQSRLVSSWNKQYNVGPPVNVWNA